MLAQGQSSSAKRGELAADVSSGLIFLKKKKAYRQTNQGDKDSDKQKGVGSWLFEPRGSLGEWEDGWGAVTAVS